MPFTSTQPLQHTDGKEYPFFGVSIITSPGFTTTAVDARVVLKLDRYRIDDAGNVQRPMQEIVQDGGDPVMVLADGTGVTLVFGSAYAQAASDPALATALTKISEALQEFITTKGL